MKIWALLLSYLSLLTLILLGFRLASPDAFSPQRVLGTSISTSPSPTPQKIILPTLTPEEHLVWYQYQNNHFTFQYPKDIKLEEKDTIRLVKVGPTQQRDTEFYDGIVVDFHHYTDIRSKGLRSVVDEELAKLRVNSDAVSGVKDIVINGVKGYEFTLEGLGRYQYIYLQSPQDPRQYVTIINALPSVKKEEYQNEVKKILNTFSFR